MKKETCQISEAEKLTGEKAHVLRYWEEELGLSIGRNAMGHRVYTVQDIQIFLSIKELKKKGLHLKAIRELLPKLRQAAEQMNMETVMHADREIEVVVPAALIDEAETAAEEVRETAKGEAEETAEQIPAVYVSVSGLKDKDRQADGQPDEEEGSIGLEPDEETKIPVYETKADGTESREEPDEKRAQFYRILERLIRQMTLKQRQEERYKRVDEAIRRHQQSRREAAATMEEKARKKKRG